MRFDIFAKRGKPVPDVLHHDLPRPLRVQIWGIVRSIAMVAGRPPGDYFGRFERFYERLHDALAHELGRFALSDVTETTGAVAGVQSFIINDEPECVLSLLDVLFELSLEAAGAASTEHERCDIFAAMKSAERELNQRFREHGAGYSIERSKRGLKVVKVTSTHLHREVVKPALAVLHAPDLAGADAEFRRAHEHHRHARHEEAITDCLKALESTLKVICTRRGWPFDDKRATASRLIDIVFDRGLVPDQMKSEFGALLAVLKSGVPTIRNRSGGHGAGAKPRVVPESLAAYALHLTAATILFLADLAKGR